MVTLHGRRRFSGPRRSADRAACMLACGKPAAQAASGQFRPGFRKTAPARPARRTGGAPGRPPRGPPAIAARPVGGPVQVAVQVVPAGATPETIGLRPPMIPGGLGAHKWQDHRVLDQARERAGPSPDEHLLIQDANGDILETDRASVFAVTEGILRTHAGGRPDPPRNHQGSCPAAGGTTRDPRPRGAGQPADPAAGERGFRHQLRPRHHPGPLPGRRTCQRSRGLAARSTGCALADRPSFRADYRPFFPN